MEEKNKIIIRICGKDYTIIGNEPEEYIQKVAFYIDKKMREIITGNPKLSTAMSAVLTSINIGDDYFKCNENLENIRKQVQVYAGELDKSMAEINILKNEVEELKQNNHSLQIELAKKETELEDFVSSFGSEK